MDKLCIQPVTRRKSAEPITLAQTGWKLSKGNYQLRRLDEARSSVLSAFGICQPASASAMHSGTSCGVSAPSRTRWQLQRVQPGRWRAPAAGVGRGDGAIGPSQDVIIGGLPRATAWHAGWGFAPADSLCLMTFSLLALSLNKLEGDMIIHIARFQRSGTEASALPWLRFCPAVRPRRSASPAP